LTSSSLSQDDAEAVAEPQGVLEGADDGGVLGLVVGHLAQSSALLDGGRALAGDDVAEGGVAGVAARGAVGVDGQRMCYAHITPSGWSNCSRDARSITV
jgi:hypothetical protein